MALLYFFKTHKMKTGVLISQPSTTMQPPTPIPNPGYHVTEIPRGEIGSSSKLLEEVLELIDAERQECKIMALIELSDLMGAIRLYLQHHAQGITVDDLEKMSSITIRAFESGRRT